MDKASSEKDFDTLCQYAQTVGAYTEATRDIHGSRDVEIDDDAIISQVDESLTDEQQAQGLELAPPTSWSHSPSESTPRSWSPRSGCVRLCEGSTRSPNDAGVIRR